MGGFFHSYHQTALKLLESYRFQEPFAVYLKQYFRQVKKHGSRDRKIVSDLCFGYFRTGNSCADLDLETAMAIGFYLTHQEDNGYLDWLKFPLLASVSADDERKVHLVAEKYPSFKFEQFFPESTSLMPEIDMHAFYTSFFNQPPFFLRVRPGKKDKLKKLIIEKGLAADWLDERTISFASNVNVTDFIRPDEDGVIQDYSSQQTFNLLEAIQSPVNVIWDVCAGSGEKLSWLRIGFQHQESMPQISEKTF